jgi:hypothetical protein
MSSESGTGTLSSSARRLGAPAKGTTADLLDGDTLTSGAAPLARWPPLSLSLSRLRGRDMERKEMARVFGGAAAPIDLK